MLQTPMDDNTTKSDISLTEVMESVKARPDYEELARDGIVRTGKKPNLEPDKCRCSTCRILGVYKPMTTIEECFDYGDCQRELIDLSSKSNLSWICANCICHDRCPRYWYPITEIPFPIHIVNPATSYLKKGGSYWNPVAGYDYLLLEHTFKEMKGDWNRGNVEILDKLKCKCDCKQCKHNLNTEMLQK